MATLVASVASLFTGGHCRAAGTRPKPLLMKTLNRKEACPEFCCKSSLTNTLLPAVTLGGGLYQNLSKVFCSLRTGASYITEAALSQVDSQTLNKIGSFGNIYFGCFAIKFVFMSRTYVQNVQYFMLLA